jgi:hypothetical protein
LGYFSSVPSRLKGVKVVASILTGRDEALPIALFDSDVTGRATAQQLTTSLYVDAKDRILEVGTFTGVGGSEIEDLIPGEVLAQVIDRWQRSPENGFVDFYQPGKPVVPQIEAWAKANRVQLIAPAWKVEVAKRTKQALLAKNAKPISDECMKVWETLFTALLK